MQNEANGPERGSKQHERLNVQNEPKPNRPKSDKGACKTKPTVLESLSLAMFAIGSRTARHR